MSMHLIRRTNLVSLFNEFVAESQRANPSGLLMGLDRQFAEQKLQVRNSSWSSIKHGSRNVGDKLARQMEVNCGKPCKWLDTDRYGCAQQAIDAHTPEKFDEDLQAFLDQARMVYLKAGSAKREQLLKLVGCL